MTDFIVEPVRVLFVRTSGAKPVLQIVQLNCLENKNVKKYIKMIIKNFKLIFYVLLDKFFLFKIVYLIIKYFITSLIIKDL
jgi:hypothetical protein